MISLTHESAMNLANQAENARRTGRAKIALSLYQQAFHLEFRAAMEAINRDIEPAASILLKGAVALAVDCDLLQKAKYLVELGIARKPPIINEFLSLRTQILSKIKMRVAKNKQQKDCENGISPKRICS